MRRILLKLWIFALAFGLGVSVSALQRIYRLSQLPPARSIVCDVYVAEPAPVAITIVGGLDACGPKANYHTLELSDGTRISQSCESFSSPAAAARALRKRLVNAEISERSENRDEGGRRTGETILVISPSVLRLSTNANVLCVTEAPSITHLRLFEAGMLYRSVKNSSDD